MEIQWHGNGCFELRGKKNTIIINPDTSAGKLKGDLVISSIKEDYAQVEDAQKVVDWPGEYEVMGIPIIGYQAWTKSKTAEEFSGPGDQTIVYYFIFEEVRFCHLGALGHVLTSDNLKAMGDIDVLFMNGGTGSNMDVKKSMEVLDSIDPKVVIPISYGENTDFLKELGLNDSEGLDKYVLKTEADLPKDDRVYILLKKV